MGEQDGGIVLDVVGRCAKVKSCTASAGCKSVLEEGPQHTGQVFIEHGCQESVLLVDRASLLNLRPCLWRATGDRRQLCMREQRVALLYRE